MFFKFKRTKTPRQPYLSKEYSMSNFIPYLCHWDSSTLLTKDKELVKVIKVDGFSFETADDDDVDTKKTVRNSLFKGIESGTIAIWFHTIRKKQRSYPEGEPTSEFAKYVNDLWKQKHGNTEAYKNEHYITIIRTNNKKGVALLEYTAKTIQHKTDRASWEKDMLDAYEELQEIADRVKNSLSSYKATELGIIKTKYGAYSEILEFLGQIVNCGYSTPMLVPTTPIASYLPNNRLYFGPKSIEAKGPVKSRFAGIVSVKEYRPTTHAGILDGFLQMPFEFIISQSFEYSDRMSAISSMQLQQNRMVSSGDVATSQIAEINQALDSSMSGEFGFGKHHLTILSITDDLRSLENALSMSLVELSNIGIKGVRERLNLEPAYWAQIPGNYDFIVRKSTINTLNLVSFESLHNYPTGKRDGNHWGPAVSVFDTVSGTPFFFNFHVRDVGHTMIVGPTGAGKTVLMNFLCAQAQKFSPRMFFFDKDHGAEIFIRAIDGVYRDIDPSNYTGFNPLQLPDTRENRTFLAEWLELLVTTNGEVMSAEEIEIIYEAIEGNYKLPRKDRRLANIMPFLGIDYPGSIANRLKMWCGDGSHAKIFDNEKDALDFSLSSTFGFEMGEVLRDKKSLNPVLLYLFHRISLSLDGTKTMIVLDEAWALIDNPVFGPKIKDWLKVLRKLNAFVVFATQSVEDATRSSISDTLVQQTTTQIFLPNLKATDVYRSVFMLSQREFELVRTTDPSSRFFLIKQDHDGVVARIDLSGMNDVISILSGRVETVILLKEIIEEHGDDPKDWLEIFFSQVKKLG